MYDTNGFCIYYYHFFIYVYIEEVGIRSVVLLLFQSNFPPNVMKLVFTAQYNIIFLNSYTYIIRLIVLCFFFIFRFE